MEEYNINLGVALFDKKLPDIHEEVDLSVQIVTALQEEFQTHRNKFYSDNKMAALVNSNRKERRQTADDEPPFDTVAEN